MQWIENWNLNAKIENYKKIRNQKLYSKVSNVNFIMKLQLLLVSIVIISSASFFAFKLVEIYTDPEASAPLYTHGPSSLVVWSLSSIVAVSSVRQVPVGWQVHVIPWAFWASWYRI